MSTVTDKLKLIKPALSDEVQQTIIDLANNFQKIDDVSDSYMDTPPTSGTWKRDKKIYRKNVREGEHIGWVNVREGIAAPKWNSLYSYRVGDRIISNNNNGHVYECIQSGQSGVTEPNFPVISNQTIRDVNGATKWQPSRKYNLHDLVFPSQENGRFYVCTVSGISGTSEPNWSVTDGGTVDDGMAVWTGYRIVTWKEIGISANFRPFGKVE